MSSVKASPLESGSLCVWEAMKMVVNHHVVEPSCALDVAREAHKVRQSLDFTPPPLMLERLKELSRGFSEQFLQQVHDYLVMLEAGDSLENINDVDASKESSLQATFCDGNFHRTPNHSSMFVGETISDNNSYRVDFNEDDLLQQVVYDQDPPEGPNPPSISRDCEFLSQKQVSSYFRVKCLTVLPFKRFFYPFPLRVTSKITFQDMLEVFYLKAIQTRVIETVVLTEEETDSLSSPFKVLLETPLALVLSYIAAFVVLMVGSFTTYQFPALTFVSNGQTFLKISSYHFRRTLLGMLEDFGVIPRQSCRYRIILK
tara:strand:- start:1720 stop:2664 length:945 start_codon:yes stop_codon:yes gene_type:complete